MKPEAIVARIGEADTLRDLPQLLRQLGSVEPEVIFEALFPIATNAQGAENGPVAFSAYVLYNLNPPCSIAVNTAIQMLIENEWDISIEEVPWYLTNQFGMDRINQCVQAFQREALDDGARVRLRTILYWSELTPGRTAGFDVE